MNSEVDLQVSTFLSDLSSKIKANMASRSGEFKVPTPNPSNNPGGKKKKKEEQIMVSLLL